MARLTAEQLKAAGKKLGWSDDEINFLLTGPVSRQIKGMVALGLEEPRYGEMAREQVRQLMKRRVNKTGGFLGGVIDWLGIGK